jgi:ubiquinone/menaquinone biosynthesis C-methylase UbiE
VKFDAARRFYMDKKLARMMPYLEPEMVGLDLGCGGGEYVTRLNGTCCQVVGVDVNAGPGLVRADMRCLPFSDGYFDFAYAVNSLHHITTRAGQRQALGEAARVLKPGGLFFLHEMNAYGNRLLRFWLRHVFTRYGAYDDGRERWLRSDCVGLMPAGMTPLRCETFSFVPDFLVSRGVRGLTAIESRLERSRWRRFGIHWMGMWQRC